MDERQVGGSGPPRWWRHGPPWLTGGDEVDRSTRWPWLSTVLLTLFVMGGSNYAAEQQIDERAALDPFARLLLLAGSLLLLWRHRNPVLVVFGTSAAAMLYLGAGYPYGPIFLAVALACFSAVVTGRRRAAWAAVGMLWAGHVLVAHWLYRWLPPSGDDAASWGAEVVVVTWMVAILAVSELARTRREQWVRERAERAQAARRRPATTALKQARATARKIGPYGYPAPR